MGVCIADDFQTSPLRRVQLIELDLLKELDQICRRHDISYWLDGGTLLGAIRHRGFIPWDDDIDVAMPRADYQRFLEVASKELPDGLSLELIGQGGMAASYAVPCKLRNINTLIYEALPESMDDNRRGLFIDILPIDVFHPKPPLKYVDILVKKLYRFFNKRRDGWRLGERAKGVFDWVFPPDLAMRWLHGLVTRYFIPRPLSRAVPRLVGYGFDVHWIRMFNAESIYPLQLLEFEGDLFPCPAKPANVLREFYGNSFMCLPDSQGRSPKHVRQVVFDLSKGGRPVCVSYFESNA